MCQRTRFIGAAFAALLVNGTYAYAESPADGMSLYTGLHDRDAIPGNAYLRPARAGEDRPESRPALTLAPLPGVPRGAVSWLARGRSAEPLSATYDAPQLTRKEMAVSYSSEGRINAYVGARESTPPSYGLSDAGDCCAGGLRAMPPATRYERGLESPAVSSALAQLKGKGLKLNLYDGWNLDAGARSREYSSPALNSRIAHITLHRWWGDWRTGYSFQVEKRGGWNVAPSQSLQLGYALAPRSIVGIAYTAGREIAFFGSQGMLKTEVRSLTLQGEHAVRKDWALKFEAGYYDHGDLPSHRSVRLALRYSL